MCIKFTESEFGMILGSYLHIKMNSFSRYIYVPSLFINFWARHWQCRPTYNFLTFSPQIWKTRITFLRDASHSSVVVTCSCCSNTVCIILFSLARGNKLRATSTKNKMPLNGKYNVNILVYIARMKITSRR